MCLLVNGCRLLLVVVFCCWLSIVADVVHCVMLVVIVCWLLVVVLTFVCYWRCVVRCVLSIVVCCSPFVVSVVMRFVVVRWSLFVAC